MTDQPFTNAHEAAWAVIDAGRAGQIALTYKAGQFLGGICFGRSTVSEKQRAWLDKLLERAGLPPLLIGGQDD